MRTLEELCVEPVAAYCFEFLVLLDIALKIVCAAPGKWELVRRPVSAGGRYVAVWPLSPGLPDVFSSITGEIDGEKVVIRPGVNIDVNAYPGMTVSPDVSLRLVAGGASSKDPVIRMWDAKHRKSAGGQISRQEMHNFLYEVDLLIVPSAVGTKIDKQLLKAHNAGQDQIHLILHSALITNGIASASPQLQLAWHDVVESFGFWIGVPMFRGAKPPPPAPCPLVALPSSAMSLPSGTGMIASRAIRRSRKKDIGMLRIGGGERGSR